MSKTTKSFRLSNSTIERLDYLVESRNEWFKSIGHSEIKITRTSEIESLILYAFLKLKGDEEKEG